MPGQYDRDPFFAPPPIKAKAPASPAAPASVPRPAPPVEHAQSTRPTSASPSVIPAAYINSQPPLGLRYSLLLSRANDPYREVDPAGSFRSGDRLKITVEANDDAYLYVIARGTNVLRTVLSPVPALAT